MALRDWSGVKQLRFIWWSSDSVIPTSDKIKIMAYTRNSIDNTRILFTTLCMYYVHFLLWCHTGLWFTDVMRVLGMVDVGMLGTAHHGQVFWGICAHSMNHEPWYVTGFWYNTCGRGNTNETRFIYGLTNLYILWSVLKCWGLFLSLIVPVLAHHMTQNVQWHREYNSGVVLNRNAVQGLEIPQLKCHWLMIIATLLWKF